VSLLFLASVAVSAVLLVTASRLPRPLSSSVAVIGFGVIAAGIVASFIGGDEGGPILLVGGVGLFWLHRWAQRDRRRMAMARFARDHGLELRTRPKEAPSEGFRLFGRGDGGRARNVLQGEWNGVPVKAFDYESFTTSAVWLFYRVKRWKRCSVAVTDLGASVPAVLTERNGAAGLAADYMGFHDVQLNSDEFNRRFHVTTDDREFAYKFFDLGMLRWLLNQQDLIEAEVLGRKAIVAKPLLDPEAMAELLDAAVGFRSHIPRLVRRKYHLSETDEAGSSTSEDVDSEGMQGSSVAPS
jgi:hypothetical protein